MNKVAQYKKILALAGPILIAHAIEASVPFINTMLVAKLGKDALAAMGLVSTTYFAMMGLGWGLIASVGIISANKLGANKHDELGAIFWGGMILSLIVGGIFSIFVFFLQPIWIFFGQNPHVSFLAQQYLHGLSIIFIADTAKYAIFQFAIACNKPKIPLIANILSIPVLIFLNIGFLWGKFGLPKLGIFGIGLGSNITYWLLFIGMLWYVLTHEPFKNHICKIKGQLSVIKAMLQQLRLGLPIGLMFSIELTFFVVFAILIGRVSVLALAANQISMQWMWFTIILVYGYGEAVTILVSKADGSQNFSLIKDLNQVGINMAMVTMFCVALFYWIMPHWIIGVDVSVYAPKNQDLVRLAVKFLFLTGLYQVLDSFRIIQSASLRGIHDTQFPMWIALIAFWFIALPLGYWIDGAFHMGGIGLWVALLIGSIFGIVVQHYRFKNKTLFKSQQLCA